MCEPVTMAILSGGLAIAGAGAQNQAAVNQANQQNQHYLDNAAAVVADTGNRYEQQQTRLVQERSASVQEMTNIGVEGLKARGTAKASAAEAGVFGSSADAIIDDLFGQQGRKELSESLNYDMKRHQTRHEMEGTRAQAQSRINSVRRAAQVDPSPFIIQGLSGAVSSFSRLSIPMPTQ